tara:strand:+ start:398 stop:628 length:231 start_codon:yes stop_codon:yes gene_type:complete
MEIYGIDDFEGNEEMVIILVEDLYKYLGNLASMVSLNYLLIISSLSAFIMFECCLKPSKKKYLLINIDPVENKIVI